MKEFKKYYIISEKPSIVYQGLIGEKTIRLWSGADVRMSAIVGDEFSMWNGDINGLNLHFEEDKEIIQQWYLQEIDKPEDASIVSIKLFDHKKGTSLLVEQNNIPEELYDELARHWTEVYMFRLINFYKEDKR